jgi:hypothetical protein
MALGDNVTKGVNVFERIGEGFIAAFKGPAFEKFKMKISSREVIAPIVYCLITMVAFALVYALIGYKELFVTNETNEKKNIENSITASIMLQSNAMGNVVAKNSLGTWLMNAQVLLGWLYFVVIVYVLM